MHKKIKQIIAATLVIGTVSCILPRNNFELGSIQAYAATYSSASIGELTSLDLTWGSGNEIKLHESYYGDEVELSKVKDYYVELKSINTFNISAAVKGSGYVVKIFTSDSKTEKGEDVGADININSIYENVYLRTYKSEEAYEEAYDNGDVSDCEKTYVIHVRKAVAVSETELDREYAYLENIHLSDGNINFSKNQTSYNVNVAEDVKEITVKATPDDDDDFIEINGKPAYEEDNFEKTIKLNKGNNTINIYVEHNDGDNEEDTTYTLNVYRGKVEDTAISTGTNSNLQDITSQSNINTWQRVDGKWRYIDGSGDVLKNQWWFDKNTEINYYLKEDGDRATGWFSNNNYWYYFDENGKMKTGWINVNKNWYYLNASGAMKMGWLEDSTGNWYYLDGSGAMKTGWVENSDGKWYYLGSTGEMIKNATVNGNSFDSNGVWIG